MGKVMAALYDWSMNNAEAACLSAWRKELLQRAEGDVLEIGAGTGGNIPYYPDRAKLVLTEPDVHMRQKLTKKFPQHETINADVENLPFGDGVFDVVVSTLVLCSVPDQSLALHEIQRVLRPGGRLLFLEHVAAADNSSRKKWQRRIDPIWSRLAGGCRLTRNTEDAINRNGFEIVEVNHRSMRKALPWVRPTITGVARKTR